MGGLARSNHYDSRQKFGAKWGRLCYPIDLMDKPKNLIGTNTTCHVMFQCYKPLSKSDTKFTYNNTNIQWIDIECNFWSAFDHAW